MLLRKEVRFEKRSESGRSRKMSAVVIGEIVSSTCMGIGKRNKRRPLYLVLNIRSLKILSEEERGLRREGTQTSKKKKKKEKKKR